MNDIKRYNCKLCGKLCFVKKGGICKDCSSKNKYAKVSAFYHAKKIREKKKIEEAKKRNL